MENQTSMAFFFHNRPEKEKRRNVMKVKMEIEMEVDKEHWEEIKKIEHHADYLLDLGSYPEIKSVRNCKIIELED